MSLGPVKLGVAPAKGLTQKFLPLEECKILLDGVKVKSNQQLTSKGSGQMLLYTCRRKRIYIYKNFTKIIEVITENYGKVWVMEHLEEG